MIFIGIDPGTHTGVAVWDSVKKDFLYLDTVPIHVAMEVVRKWTIDSTTATERRGKPAYVIFEDARQRTWFKKEQSLSEYRGRLQGAGAAKRDSAIWEDFLSDHRRGLGNRCTYEAHKPQPGTTKWTAATFARYTGYTGRTSEHSRDAALLVWGKR